MTTWLSGMRITADRLNDGSPNETTTTGVTAESGFSVTSFLGRKRLGVVYITVQIMKTSGTLESDTDNENVLGDPTIATLPDGWRPPERTGASWDTGTINGNLVINPDGTIDIRTISYNQSVPDSSNISFSTSWIGS